ncbi:isochorismatase family protein [Pseudoalteromonas fuliginea]|uniref:isochorismatase family protein n=1 Tax=Pseudoalteromonas fuliginea TaxID=1872678 RepID=UPI003177E724
MSRVFNIDASQSVILVIDLQSKLAPAIECFPTILSCTLQLAQTSLIYGIPVLITEQYKKGLGGTQDEIKALLPKATYFDKTHFSACAEPDFLASMKQFARPQIIVVGTEAHVCVLQTCLDLLQSGFDVIVIADAVGSRNEKHKQIAIDQLQQAGAIISCAETVIFQWVKNSATTTFREVLSIIK